MIALLEAQGLAGPIAVALQKSDGSVTYRKDGAVQSCVDARGRNLAPYVDKAVSLFVREGARRVLVLGYGGGVASSLLHARGIDVVSVDCDACAEPLARLFFRAPPSLNVVVADAARYVESAPAGGFDGVLVDIQDSADTPALYLDPSFWTSLAAVLRPAGLVVLALTAALHSSRDWRRVRCALRVAGLDAAAVSRDLGGGVRLLVTAAS
jgi:predicted membrane-bound spermidine synthase